MRQFYAPEMAVLAGRVFSVLRGEQDTARLVPMMAWAPHDDRGKPTILLSLHSRGFHWDTYVGIDPNATDAQILERVRETHQSAVRRRRAWIERQQRERVAGLEVVR